ncbi:MAG: hypothetical protein NTX82_00995 [Candidatus Parcubacteria bacterium]|nr:hypothetical protein [Candidatus Parcubacteria bacterium]
MLLYKHCFHQSIIDSISCVKGGRHAFRNRVDCGEYIGGGDTLGTFFRKKGLEQRHLRRMPYALEIVCYGQPRRAGL